MTSKIPSLIVKSNTSKVLSEIEDKDVALADGLFVEGHKQWGHGGLIDNMFMPKMVPGIASR